MYMLRFVFRKSAFLDGGLRAFFGVLYASLIGFYVKFCFDYPYDCTQDFRYIVPVAVIGALFLGLGLTDRPGACIPGRDAGAACGIVCALCHGCPFRYCFGPFIRFL